jgi:TonB family protein
MKYVVTHCRTMIAICLMLGFDLATAAQTTTQQLAAVKTRVEADSANPVSVEAYNNGLAAKGPAHYCAFRTCETGPTLLKGRAPVYPADLLDAGIEGSAAVLFDIDARGLPQNIAVQSATAEAFGAAASDAVKSWRFRPARLGGKPVTFQRALQLFPFELRD